MLKKNTGIISVMMLFLIANLIFLSFYDEVWWDSSVYIGMGKHIFSLGESGLWEESRPLTLPLILGIGWFLNLDAVFFGRVISIIFAVLVIYMTYQIGIRLLSEKIALLATFFTAFSYNFLLFGSNILTEIPSTLFVLLAFYHFLNKRFFFVGLFSGIALMTRFFQIFTLVGLVLVFIAYFYKKPNFTKKLLYLAFGASIFILPYFLLNYYLYNDILLPFKVQTHLTKTTGWMNYHEPSFYVTDLIKENLFLAFLLFLPFYFKKNYKFFALMTVPLVYILIFSFAGHKEMRFMIVILPFLYLLTSYCLARTYSKIRNKRLALGAFSVMIIAWLMISLLSLADAAAYSSQRDDKGLLYFQDYLKNNEGNIWITNPLYALYSDGKIEGLLYFYSSEKLTGFVGKNKDKVDTILFNSCDIPCPPEEMDSLCGESRKALDAVISNFEQIYEKEINSCKYQIFRKPTSLP